MTATLHPRQTLLFSATLPANLERLARSAVLNPVRPVIVIHSGGPPPNNRISMKKYINVHVTQRGSSPDAEEILMIGDIENCEGWLSPGGHSSGGRVLTA